MAIVGLVVGVIGMLQGVAWLGERRVPRRDLQGALLACSGQVVVMLALVWWLAPAFFR